MWKAGNKAGNGVVRFPGIFPAFHMQPSDRFSDDEAVLLDRDLAALYGVETTVFNQALKRNAHRFPRDFAFQLTAKELAAMRSQIVTS